MRKYVRTLTLAVSMVVVLLLLQGSLAGASASDDGGRSGRELTFRVMFSPFNYTDLGPTGPSAADVIVFHDQLFQTGNRVGDEVGSCVLVDPTGLSNCTGVVRLDDRGTITFSFVNAPPPHKVLAVTGGSGQFRTARGDGTLDENGDGTGTLVLRLSA
ncbi:MAG: hypothetical protein WCG47_17870 [Dermatophilaceae bacterium]